MKTISFHPFSTMIVKLVFSKFSGYCSRHIDSFCQETQAYQGMNAYGKRSLLKYDYNYLTRVNKGKLKM